MKVKRVTPKEALDALLSDVPVYLSDYIDLNPVKGSQGPPAVEMWSVGKDCFYCPHGMDWGFAYIEDKS